MQKNLGLGLVIFLVGMLLFGFGTVYSLVTVVIPSQDTTPPGIGTLAIPLDGATYSSVSTLYLYCGDLDSGIKSVTCKIDSTTYALAYSSSGGPVMTPEYWNYQLATPITVSGSHTFSFTVTNKVDLMTVKSGSFTIYKGFQGTWYVNGVEITDPLQTIYATNATVDFKFVKTVGVADTLITCGVWEGTNWLLILTNYPSSIWTGSYTFTSGKHTLDLKAYDGTQTITMSVIGLQVGSPTGFEWPQLSSNKIYGLMSAICGSALMGIGVLLMITGKKS